LPTLSSAARLSRHHRACCAHRCERNARCVKTICSPPFLVKGEGKCRQLDDRVEAFASKIKDNLVVIDPRDFALTDIDDKFRWILAPCVASTLLVNRLAAHFEHYTGHSLEIRRYYRQFDY